MVVSEDKLKKNTKPSREDSFGTIERYQVLWHVRFYFVILFLIAGLGAISAISYLQYVQLQELSKLVSTPVCKNKVSEISKIEPLSKANVLNRSKETVHDKSVIDGMVSQIKVLKDKVESQERLLKDIGAELKSVSSATGGAVAKRETPSPDNAPGIVKDSVVVESSDANQDILLVSPPDSAESAPSLDATPAVSVESAPSLDATPAVSYTPDESWVMSQPDENLTLQLMSSGSKSAMMAALDKKGLVGYRVIEKKVSGAVIYVAFAGSFKTEEEAMERKISVKALAGISGWVKPIKIIKNNLREKL